MNKSYIYIIGSIEQFEIVKIGISSKLPYKGRLQELQTGNPFELKVWASMLCLRSQALRCESAIHKRLGNFRMKGEWFRVKPQHAYKVCVDEIGLSNAVLKSGGTNVKPFCGKEMIASLVLKNNQAALSVISDCKIGGAS